MVHLIFTILWWISTISCFLLWLIIKTCFISSVVLPSITGYGQLALTKVFLTLNKLHMTSRQMVYKLDNFSQLLNFYFPYSFPYTTFMCMVVGVGFGLCLCQMMCVSKYMSRKFIHCYSTKSVIWFYPSGIREKSYGKEVFSS